MISRKWETIIVVSLCVGILMASYGVFEDIYQFILQKGGQL